MQSLGRQFNLKTGFSDHSGDWLAPATAVAMGAVLVEKHFKLHDSHECCDAAVSLGEEQFRTMVKEIRRIETMLGEGAIVRVQGEEAVARAARRSLFAARNLAAGTTITAADLVALRPGNGIPVSRAMNYRKNNHQGPVKADILTGGTLLFMENNDC
jgi:sialic acid synthase SpsE